MGPKLIAVTLGSEGVLIATNDMMEQVDAFQTEVVDTTGAGAGMRNIWKCNCKSLCEEVRWNSGTLIDPVRIMCKIFRMLAGYIKERYTYSI